MNMHLEGTISLEILFNEVEKKPIKTNKAKVFDQHQTPVINTGEDVGMKGAASWENQQSAYAKTKAQISFAVTAKLISAFVFATRIVRFLLYLTPKFQASSLLL